MRFWDSSAVLPLLVSDLTSDKIRTLFTQDPEMIVWWGTEIECVSAIARLEREDSITSASVGSTIDQLRKLARAWHEIQPNDQLRRIATRLLRTHPLRAADSLQLAATLIASENQSETLEFVTLDDRLAEAAQREGFRVLP